MQTPTYVTEHPECRRCGRHGQTLLLQADLCEPCLLAAEPTVICRPGPLWPLVIHHAFRLAVVAALIAAVVR